MGRKDSSTEYAVDRKRRKERSARTYVSSYWAGAMEEQPACSSRSNQRNKTRHGGDSWAKSGAYVPNVQAAARCSGPCGFFAILFRIYFICLTGETTRDI